MSAPALPLCQHFLLERDKDWLTIWFNRPDARNALSKEVSAELGAVVAAVREDQTLRGVTMRGKGKVFCAGGDIKGFQDIFQGGEQSLDDVAAANAETGELFHQVNTLPQVVVVLVQQVVDEQPVCLSSAASPRVLRFRMQLCTYSLL